MPWLERPRRLMARSMRVWFLVFLSVCVLSLLSYLETVFAPFVVVVVVVLSFYFLF